MASLSSKRKTSVNRRLQQTDARGKTAPKAPAGRRDTMASDAGTPALAANPHAGFDLTVYSKLKTRFETAIASAGDDSGDLKHVMRVLVQQEFDDGGRDAALKLQPYIVKYVGEYRDGRQTSAGSAA